MDTRRCAYGAHLPSQLGRAGAYYKKSGSKDRTRNREARISCTTGKTLLLLTLAPTGHGLDIVLTPWS